MGDVPNRLVGLIAEAGGKAFPLRTIDGMSKTGLFGDASWSMRWSCMTALSRQREDDE